MLDAAKASTKMPASWANPIRGLAEDGIETIDDWDVETEVVLGATINSGSIMESAERAVSVGVVDCSSMTGT